MILALAVLLFQSPIAKMPASAVSAAQAASPVASAMSAPAASTSAISPAPPNKVAAAAPSSPSASTSTSPDASKPPASSNSPVNSKSIIHSPASATDLNNPSLGNFVLPPPPPFRLPNEVPVSHRRLWLLLGAAEHSAAAYDAWSTRYALSNGRVEADPLMRPFADSAAIYPAIQLIPFGLDYLGHRFQRSTGWTRHIWWLPQAAGTVTFAFSGSYNVAHTN